MESVHEFNSSVVRKVTLHYSISKHTPTQTDDGLTAIKKMNVCTVCTLHLLPLMSNKNEVKHSDLPERITLLVRFTGIKRTACFSTRVRGN